jgi:hypothetical protein
MRITTIAILGLSAVAVAGCGSGSKFANRPRPATPVDLTVYINNNRVSVSPASVGAGPVIFIITNQASKAESLTIFPAGSSAAASLADTGPINPQATAQVTVDLDSPGDYTVTTATSSSTDAASTAAGIEPASLHVGRARPSASNVLLQP